MQKKACSTQCERLPWFAGSSFSLLVHHQRRPLQNYVEGAIALLLAGRIATIPASAAAFFLSLIFATVHTWALITGSTYDCGCAGTAFTHATAGSHAGLLGVALIMAVASGFELLSPTGGAGPSGSMGSSSASA